MITTPNASSPTTPNTVVAPTTPGIPASARRPLEHQMLRTWFLETPAMRLYALRELTSVFIALFTLHAMWAAMALARGLEAWLRWVEFARSPAVTAATVLTLVCSLLAASTWFHATPAVIRVRLGERILPNQAIVVGQYAAALGVLTIAIWIARVPS